jgi:hypothetical protein
MLILILLKFCQTVMSVQATSLRLDPIYYTIYITGLYMVVMYVVPFIILLVLNCRIGIEIHRARLRRHDIVANGHSNRSNNGGAAAAAGITPSTSMRNADECSNNAGLILHGSKRTR